MQPDAKEKSNAKAEAPMLCLTMCAYRKSGLAEEEYRRYMTEIHAPRVRQMLVKYGIDKYSMAHNSSETRSLMSQIGDTQFANVADYDCIIQIQFRDIQQFVQLKADPEYLSSIAPDHEQFADTKLTRMTIGWMTDIVRDGQIV